MGRFFLFIVIIVAALAGVWFFMPGGKDLLSGVTDKAMSYVPGAAKEEAAPAVDEAAVDEIVVEDAVVEETPAEEAPAEEAPAEEPQN